MEFKRTLKVSKYRLLCLIFISVSLPAAENYTVSIDGTDTWANGVTNFLDVTSSISTENSAIDLTADATIGTPDGTVSYVALNPNSVSEVNVNIANSNAIDMKASFIWDVKTPIFPYGIQDPSFTFRDIDSNTGPGGSNEFCDRLEFRAFDIAGNPIAASNFSYVGDDSAIASSSGNLLAVEANDNDTLGTGTATFTISHDNVQRVEVIYEACEVDTDTDRPGAAGIVGLTAFAVATTDLTIRKQWVDANVNDATTVSVTGGTVTIPNLNSVANSSNEVDNGATIEVISGADYTISEALDGGNAGTYVGSLSCTGTSDDVSNGVLTPGENDINIICIYLNDQHLSDLRVTKSDSSNVYTPGAPVSYVITVFNDGPDAVAGVTVVDNMPAGFVNVTWDCVASGGASCPNASGSGNINELLGNLPNGGELEYTVNGNYSVDPSQY